MELVRSGCETVASARLGSLANRPVYVLLLGAGTTSRNLARGSLEIDENCGWSSNGRHRRRQGELELQQKVTDLAAQVALTVYGMSGNCAWDGRLSRDPRR
jgi:hypothetical protein